MSLALSGERIILRETIRDDLPAHLDIYNSNPGYNLLRNGTEKVTFAEVASEYDSTLSIPTGQWLTLLADGQIIGVMHLVIMNPADQKSWISLLLLHADCQRNGYGREAVQLAEQHFASAGSAHVHHGVIARNEPALLFWGRLGYEQYRQVLAPVGRLEQPVLLVAKWLTPSQ
ncbi:GNAT family N-acetyltransferase [Brevibacillus choshinensis]|uniref:GNAT family N-acetyltransferase n=1 Tax=Brevibacillus choshinensis TaxID=54911 RepID=A0ABX7FQC5_BRECH|nr:GNAT family N-acetyltransferase [Brevibacillus choshinensis]QRG68449.1 GNAT family N-acetyltransferase [Brevibacillus choshinensis]